MTPSASLLLKWYDAHRRTLPWRSEAGAVADPYHVWLSEVMLQQTTVVTVRPYFTKFLTLFPTVGALARADLSTVLAAWAGLGYYARARNLHACAQAVDVLGGFPKTIDGLRALPGIGVYTANAIGAIAFGIPAVPVDGNVERVTSRVFAVDEPLPGVRPTLARKAATLNQSKIAQARPSDFAQALFDLGATVCTPRNPLCDACPWQKECAGYAQGIAPELPRRAAKPAKPVRYGAHFLLSNSQREVLLRIRPSNGLLGGMTEIPGTLWRDTVWPQQEALLHAPAKASWEFAGTITHTFTHFTLMIDVYRAQLDSIKPATNTEFLCAQNQITAQALPTVMRKCIECGHGSRQPRSIGKGRDNK